MTHHELKIDPIYFDNILKGHKHFEIRKDDRNYTGGDIICLREYDRDTCKYSGRRYWAEIGVVFTFLPGLKAGYCAFDLTHRSRIQKRNYGKLYRLNHTELRNKTRKNNYIQTRPAVRKNVPWSKLEVWLLNMLSSFSDREFADLFKRSVQAIQQKRHELREEGLK